MLSHMLHRCPCISSNDFQPQTCLENDTRTELNSTLLNLTRILTSRTLEEWNQNEMDKASDFPPLCIGELPMPVLEILTS